MAILLGILILLFGFLLLLLLTPLKLNIDSSTDNYQVSFGAVTSLTLIPGQEEWYFLFKLGFWKKKFLVSSLFEGLSQSEKKKVKPKDQAKRKKANQFKSMKTAWRVLRSFKIKICKIDLDTDDFYWNALLIPAFQLVNRGKQHRVNINFEGKNKVLLLIENRPIIILYSILFRK